MIRASIYTAGIEYLRVEVMDVNFALGCLLLLLFILLWVLVASYVKNKATCP